MACSHTTAAPPAWHPLQAVALQKAAGSLIAVGKPLNFNVPRVGLRGFRPVIDTAPGAARDPAVCIAALRAGAALGGASWPSIYSIPYFVPPPAGPTVANNFRQVVPSPRAHQGSVLRQCRGIRLLGYC